MKDVDERPLTIAVGLPRPTDSTIFNLGHRVHGRRLQAGDHGDVLRRGRPRRARGRQAHVLHHPSTQEDVGTCLSLSSERHHL